MIQNNGIMLQTFLYISNIQTADGGDFNWLLLLLSAGAYVYQNYRKANQKKSETIPNDSSEEMYEDNFEFWDEEETEEVIEVAPQKSTSTKSDFQTKEPSENDRKERITKSTYSTKAKKQFRFNKKHLDARQVIIYSEIINKKYF